MSVSGRIRRVRWSTRMAYAVGLVATDGCLSRNGRNIDLTSKDTEQLQTFMACVGKQAKIGKKISGSTGRYTPRVQFSDPLLYKFFREVGITPRKTKTISSLRIPDVYFFDFLRGHFDGDGSFYSYWDPRWKSSFMFYLTFVSASPRHLDWLRGSLGRLLGVRGHLTHAKNASWYQLKYAKAESLKIIKKMYYSSSVPCLRRKKEKIFKALQHGNKDARVVKLADTLP